VNVSTERVLVLGGAGFIGSHLVDALDERGHRVVVYDVLEPQVHGPDGQWPSYLHRGAERVLADVRDGETLARWLAQVDVVFYMAAAVGVGQSMYEIRRYTDVNVMGAATLAQLLAERKHSVRKVVVASSMSLYGEGAYRCIACGVVYPSLRPEQQVQAREWEMRCPQCGIQAVPIATSEAKPLHPTSIYAINKRDHEEMLLCIGRAYGIPTVALRYFNVYGPRQALSNPYTGVVAIFSARLMNGSPPVVFEDGLQSRDFVHVSDIAQANLRAMDHDAADYEVLNVGTGRPTTVLQIASTLAKLLDVDIEPEITGKFRAGDIRHCYADIGKIQALLGYQPKVSLDSGMSGLVEWLPTQQGVESLVPQAVQELMQRGLTR